MPIFAVVQHIAKYKKWISYVWPWTLERRESAFNRVLEVELYNGKLMLNSKQANYSFGRLHQVMQKVLQVLKSKNANFNKILLLGYGGGSAAQLIHYIHPEAKIDAVEIDAVVVELAKKWFYSKGVNFILGDASEVVYNLNHQDYDIIICDVFADIYVPDSVRSGEFYKQCSNLLATNGIMVHNVMLKQQENKIQTEVFSLVFDAVDSFSMFGSNTVFHGVLRQP